jgi:tRNA(Ile)-lysidine synthase
MQLLDRVRQTIRRHDLARAETRVVAALSGGSDSVALAHLLHALHAAGELQLVGLAHFNHQLRAAASDDETFCCEVAATLESPLLVDREDVRDRARRERRSIEDAARTARHAFFERARLHFQADAVALGHTRDDQAETFLLRLLRGAGARGLAGMHPRRGAVIRPLLECRRQALRAYLESAHLPYVDDESNLDVGIPRNRIRAELLPLLETRFNPSIVDVLAEEAEVARGEWEWTASVYREEVDRLVRHENDTWRIEAQALAALPLALGRLVIQHTMVEASGGRVISFAHVEEALRLARETGAPIDLPRQRLERIDGDLVLTGRPAGAVGRVRSETSGTNLFQYPLSIPGEVLLSETACLVSAETATSAAAAAETCAIAGNPAVALVRLDRCRGPLAVRNRRPGDRFHPPGVGGRKKLQDYFVDRKVARQRRDAVPLVVDESDRIVWVAGHAIDEDFRVTDAAQAVLILRLKQVQGEAPS